MFVDNSQANLEFVGYSKNQCFFLGDCDPYSKEACEYAIDHIRDYDDYGAVTKGGVTNSGNSYEFADNYGTKGCYYYRYALTGTYDDMAFYGTDGSIDEMKEELNSPQKRPPFHQLEEFCDLKNQEFLKGPFISYIITGALKVNKGLITNIFY